MPNPANKIEKVVLAILGCSSPTILYATIFQQVFPPEKFWPHLPIIELLVFMLGGSIQVVLLMALGYAILPLILSNPALE